MAAANSIAEIVAYASIAGASAFYSWLWWTPAPFKRLSVQFGYDDPCVFMALVANIFKLAQFGSLAFLTNWKAAVELPAWQVCIALAFVIAGQHLNFLVFKLLGLHGTYYGCRLLPEKRIPWVTAYPFGYVKDPQYVGGILTLVGAAFVAPLAPVFFWMLNYVYLMWLEKEQPKK